MRAINIVGIVLVFVAAAFATPAFAAPGEVVNVQWCTGTKTCLQWDTEPSATQYRIYRGERASFPCLLNPSVESCDDGTFTTTTTSGTITDTPPAGGMFWFLVTAKNGSGEGTPGTATAGARLQNLNGTCLPTCGLSGQSCSIDADCCSAACVAGTCQALCCQPTTAFCAIDSDCCSGACSGNQCQAPCTVASQCPGPDTDCQVRTCNAGTCGFSYTLAGTPTTSQFPGDCHQTVCDGSGNITNLVDNNDLPNDGNQCTNDSCVNGTPSYQPVPLNSACNQAGGSVCDGVGHCVQCNSASQCPGSDTECRVRTCSSQTCGFTFVTAGTVVASQSPGDCHTNMCDGAGNIVGVVDNNDTPADDGNQCTGETCIAGTPSHPALPLNSTCNQGGGVFCNGTGACVECVSASQCPGTDTDCRSHTCTSFTCGFANAPTGTVTAGQTSGDCHTNQCDGVGNVMNVVDGNDIPLDDGNQCTGEACISGVPSHPASPVNTACNQSGGVVCDGAGSCVAPPQVVSTVPTDGASVPAGTAISVTFSQVMDPASLTGQTSAGACSGTIQVSIDDFATCTPFSSAAPTMSGGGTVAGFTPQPGLLVNRTYKIRVTTAAHNASSISLSSTFTQATGFTTLSPNLCDGSLAISQVYGGGGGTGATYQNDFIELHNRGTSTISLTGMSVQYASATGTTWLSQTNLSGSIPAGGYFLIQEAGGATGAVLPAPDLTASGSGLINMAVAAGKLALVANQTSLTGACPSGGAIVDFIGYGTTATCNEGGSNAPAPSASTSISRQQQGCADLNVNGTDLVAGTPAPRNSATTANVCACVARNESNAAAEADFCAVTFPQSLSAQTGTSTGSIFGQLYEAGVTEAAGPAAIVRAQLGYGLPTVNPEYQPGFTWVTPAYNIQSGNNDEYAGSFTAPAAGSYRYVYRFSVDAGVSWTYCDGNQIDGGAGSNAGLNFDFTTLPVLTVTP